MKATGIVRRVDDLGRIVIPKEIRRTLRIREGDPLNKSTKYFLPKVPCFPQWKHGAFYAVFCFSRQRKCHRLYDPVASLFYSARANSSVISL